MRRVLAIDPGTEKSAMLIFDGDAISVPVIIENGELLLWLRNQIHEPLQVAVEMIACYGMPVGKETFETCLMIGRIQEICRVHHQFRKVYRKDVKIHLCGSMKAKDGNIRQALIDKYGAPGTKKAPGRTYGISSHLWSALAIADYVLCNPLQPNA